MYIYMYTIVDFVKVYNINYYIYKYKPVVLLSDKNRLIPFLLCWLILSNMEINKKLIIIYKQYIYIKAIIA